MTLPTVVNTTSAALAPIPQINNAPTCFNLTGFFFRTADVCITPIEDSSWHGFIGFQTQQAYTLHKTAELHCH